MLYHNNEIRSLSNVASRAFSRQRASTGSGCRHHLYPDPGRPWRVTPGALRDQLEQWRGALRTELVLDISTSRSSNVAGDSLGGLPYSSIFSAAEQADQTSGS